MSALIIAIFTRSSNQAWTNTGINVWNQCKTKAHMQDIHFQRQVLPTPCCWHGGLMYMKQVCMRCWSVHYLHPPPPILTNFDHSMYLYHMSIKMEIAGVMAQRRYLKWTGGEEDSSGETDEKWEGRLKTWICQGNRGKRKREGIEQYTSLPLK